MSDSREQIPVSSQIVAPVEYDGLTTDRPRRRKALKPVAVYDVSVWLMVQANRQANVITAAKRAGDPSVASWRTAAIVAAEQRMAIIQELLDQLVQTVSDGDWQDARNDIHLLAVAHPSAPSPCPRLTAHFRAASGIDHGSPSGQGGAGVSGSVGIPERSSD